MQINSPAFKNNDNIPSKYTRDSENINPPLQFADVPGNTKSLVLICDDPDAPMGNWVHWLVWNIDPKTTSIPENSVPTDSIQGTTSFGETKYGGPCPPSGVHHYYFKLHALDIKLNLPASTKKAELESVMQNHLLASSNLVGLYTRSK